MNHDCAAGIDAYALRVTTILLVGVGHMDRQKKNAAGISAIQQIGAFRRHEISFLRLIANRADSECDIETPKRDAILQQVQFPLGLFDKHLVGDRKFARYRNTRHDCCYDGAQ